MGLTNSCDFSTTTLVIIGNRVVKKGKDETGQRMDGSVLVDCVVTSALETNENPTTVHDQQIETHPTGNTMAIQSSASQDNCESNETDTEHRPVKRVRKPTRRYIEEISEGESRESGAQTVSSVEPPACDQSSAQVCVRSIQNFGLDQRYLLRKDSLGGCGIQVPYVNRIRRSRPRKNFVTLVKVASFICFLCELMFSYTHYIHGLWTMYMVTWSSVCSSSACLSTGEVLSYRSNSGSGQIRIRL